jgi:hypothetical protein
MRDEIQVRRLLDIPGEELEAAGVVDRVVAVVTGLLAPCLPGRRGRGHVHDAGKPPARDRVERFVHGG